MLPFILLTVLVMIGAYFEAWSIVVAVPAAVVIAIWLHWRRGGALTMETIGEATGSLVFFALILAVVVMLAWDGVTDFLWHSG